MISYDKYVFNEAGNLIKLDNLTSKEIFLLNEDDIVEIAIKESVEKELDNIRKDYIDRIRVMYDNFKYERNLKMLMEIGTDSIKDYMETYFLEELGLENVVEKGEE